MEDAVDIFIIGGGINGTAIAADAAGRGLSVTLCEQNDLASATSSASTKLIHGGLRYLEQYEFILVKKALQEREILMRRAPHLIAPLEFVLPHEKHLRPAWIIRCGLFLYDHLSRRRFLPSSRSINLKKDNRGTPLRSGFKKGFSYYDCLTDDARLTISNALSAKEQGATILTHTKFISAEREKNGWKIQLQNHHTHQDFFCYAKALVNAAGPWVKAVQKNISSNQLPFDIKLIKGSHIVVPKLYEGDFAYILQHADKRIIFAIPYQQQFTLIGTTDVSFKDEPHQVDINDEEKHYLCNVINHYFQKNVSPSDIVWSYSGVRCLEDDHAKKLSEVSRDYKLLLENNSAPLLTVIGGKITTHRTLAEDVLQKLQPFFPSMKSSWTEKYPLPGGNFPENQPELFLQKIKLNYPWLPDDMARRYVNHYGTRINYLLADAHSLDALGIHFGCGLYQKEVEYLINNEWAETSDDILWRRTKLGLFFSEGEIKKLQEWLSKADVVA